MFVSYCRILFRHLRKTKLYVLINIVGLGIGIAAMIWGIQVYRFYGSFDEFHQNKEQIYRVLITVAGGDGLKGPCPVPVGEAAKQDYPVVKEAVRWERRPMAVLVPGKDAFTEDVNFTSPAFFDLFSFPLVKGQARLADPATVVITETSAKKFFGGVDPIGKTLLLYSDQPYKRLLTVTGIVKDPPFNSSLQFETLTSTENFLSWNGSPVGSDDWSQLSDALFVKLADPQQAGQLGKVFERYLPLQRAARQDLKVTSFTLESLMQAAAQSGVIDKNSLLERPGGAAVYGPLILALLVLVSACLNFANTTVAQSAGG